jgi:hypothetical protein
MGFDIYDNSVANSSDFWSQFSRKLHGEKVCNFRPLPINLFTVVLIHYKATIGFHSKGRLLALPANIRLGMKWLTVTSTLAYHGTDGCNNIIVKATLPCLEQGTPTKGRSLSTIDLLVLINFDHFYIQNIVYLFITHATLIRRSAIQSVPFNVGFPALNK